VLKWELKKGIKAHKMIGAAQFILSLPICPAFRYNLVRQKNAFQGFPLQSGL
jgi:hypothetical protein